MTQFQTPILGPEKLCSLVLLVATALLVPSSQADDWPMWGRDGTRNPVTREKGAPLDFAVATRDPDGKITRAAKNVAWEARIGSMSTSGVVVANGLVWIGTNNAHPRDPGFTKDAAVLMCFRESNGEFLWQYLSPRLSDGHWLEDSSWLVMGSAPLVEDDRLWFVSNRCEVICLDIGPLRRGIGTPVVHWKVDLRKQFGVFPHMGGMAFGLSASVAAYKDWLYAVTHNGVGEDYKTVPRPNAPSLICLEKKTGKLVWQDNSPGKNILKSQLSSPVACVIKGKAQVIVGQGDGWLRSFEAATGKLLWKCDLNPKDATWKGPGRGTRNYIVATPVLYEDRIYIGTGQEVVDGTSFGCLYCIDATKEGDVSRELDAGPGKGKPNPNSAVIWHTMGRMPSGVPKYIPERGYLFGGTVASCAIADGLVYAADLDGFLFCFDARTGTLYWTEDINSPTQVAPLWAAGKLYVINEDLLIFAHGKQKKLLSKVELTSFSHSNPVYANGRLYCVLGHNLYAIHEKN
jgi:outer membrane protein assembly factor BamB